MRIMIAGGERDGNGKSAPLGERRAIWSIVLPLLPYIWPRDRRDLQLRVIVALLLLLATKLATLAVPILFKLATDALAGPDSRPVASPQWLLWLAAAPVAIVIAYCVTRIAESTLAQVRDSLFGRVAMHAVRRIAVRTFAHLHELSLRFHLERKIGGLSRILERGRNGIEIIARLIALQLLPTFIELLLIGGYMMWQFDWRYVATILLTVVAYVFSTYRLTEYRLGIRRDVNSADTESNSKAIDSLINYEAVKYFNSEPREVARYDAVMTRYEDASVKSINSLSMMNSANTLLFTAGLGVAMIMCALEVQAGTKTMGDFVLVNAMMLQLYQPLYFVGLAYREIKQAATDIEAMWSILEETPEIKDRAGALPLAVSNGAVTFDNVVFAYEPDRQILKGISFEVPAGKSLAVVGPSGSGKSTIARLLFRLYDVTSGRILIDGQDIGAVTQVSLRDAIGIVPQDTMLFNDTIRYNIRYGCWGATDAEVEDATRSAQLDGLIRAAPAGYDTEVGERGLKLSGGEKQRVAIARTMLKNPRVLVLDEATSALDTATEKEIQNALDRLSRNRTTLIIAHRLSTVVRADEIIVLDRGAIAERGTHRALLACGGLYASMWQRQQEADAARHVEAGQPG
ncbi:MAG: ABC transporter ATP-binding protein/permease [Xanthobacteraceae bacterium]|nr:ABC transporter ATP-binding protein/permease [Xanthobacteraceae bacterium]